MIYLCHLATYDFAAPFAAGNRVLDFGCGTGYGTHRLSGGCASIVGVDISDDAVAFAQERYHAPNLSYQAIRPLPEHQAPFDEGSFDVITSFQVVEHIWEVASYVDELHRLLAPGGTAIVATPDRATRLFRGQRPWNRYHVVEYDDASFRQVLRARFPSVEMHYMGAEPDVEALELRRARLLRLATYPITFPSAPERWRARGLDLLKALQTRRSRTAPATPIDHGFDLDAVHLSSVPRPSLNLVAVVRKD